MMYSWEEYPIVGANAMSGAVEKNSEYARLPAQSCVRGGAHGSDKEVC